MTEQSTSGSPQTMTERIEQLRDRREEVMAGGGQARLDKQRAAGKLTARERVAGLVDPGTFEEFGMHAQHRTTLFGMDTAVMPADGVITGAAAVLGRPVHLASQDFSVAGGSAGEMHSTKVATALHSALENGTPFIFINDSGGARVQEGIDSLSGYGKVFFENVALSGVVPQISIIAGPCAGGAAYSPALTDFIIQTRASRMFITGPDVIKQVTGEDVSAEALGGPDAHMAHSGNTHFVAEDDEQALLIAKKLLSFLPSNNTEEPPLVEGFEEVERDLDLDSIIPEDPKKAYDVRDVIGRLVDNSDFLEVQAGFAGNLVVGFARITGRSVGIIANNPSVMSGVLDVNSSDKGARFIRFCNAFNIPLVTLVDVPGFLPGVAQEYGGIIRTARRCSSPTPRRRSRRSPSCSARPTAAPISRCAPRIWAPTASSPGRPPRSPSWAPRGPRGSSSAARSRPPRIRSPKRPSSSSTTATPSPPPTSRPPAASSTTSSSRATPAVRWRGRWRICSPSASSARPRSTD